MSNVLKLYLGASIILLVVISAYIFYQVVERNSAIDNTTDGSQQSYGGVENPTGEIDMSPRIVADNLEVPWDIAFLPDNRMLVTERVGRLQLIASGDTRREIAIPGADNIQARGEGGLLGITLHPNFRENGWVYLYMTISQDNRITNSVVRYEWQNDELVSPLVVIENIPGSINHDGGRIEFGPDGYLYIATGDATNVALAPDEDSLAGKILRIEDDGAIPSDNPFNNAVYSIGHRNPQGLAWDSAGRLWSTEHGRSGALSGLDEINLIQSGANYGWPDSEGDSVASGTVGPSWHSGASDTWAPASAAYVDGNLFFGGLRGQALYQAALSGTEVLSVNEHFKNEYGRIRTVRVGPDGHLYFTTSNRDGRGSPNHNDDKIIRIHPSAF